MEKNYGTMDKTMVLYRELLGEREREREREREKEKDMKS